MILVERDDLPDFTIGTQADRLFSTSYFILRPVQKLLNAGNPCTIYETDFGQHVVFDRMTEWT